MFMSITKEQSGTDETKAYSFTVMIMQPVLTYKKVYAESSFINEISQLTNEAQLLTVDKCIKEFVLILRNTLQSLLKKALRKRKQHNSFPCNKWLNDECM